VFAYRHPRYLASILIAVKSVLLEFTASNCIVFGEYVLYALNQEPSQFEGKVLGLGLLTVIVAIHSCFLKTGILIQNVLGWVKIALAIFMVFRSLFMVIFRRNQSTESAIPPKINSSYLWDGSVWNWCNIQGFLLLCWPFQRQQNAQISSHYRTYNLMSSISPSKHRLFPGCAN
jgi:hypothetical protein